jgi:hypothetical protein
MTHEPPPSCRLETSTDLLRLPTSMTPGPGYRYTGGPPGRATPLAVVGDNA